MNKLFLFIITWLTISATHAQSKDSECVEQLMNLVAEKNIKGVESIISNGCDVNFKHKIGSNYWICPLSRAVHNSDTNIIKALLAAGANPSIDLGIGSSPFQYAAGNSTIEILSMLHKNGGNVNQHNQRGTPLGIAIRNNKIENVEFLIKNGANFKSSLGSTIIQSREKLQIARLFLENGAIANFQSNEKIGEYDYGDCISCPVGISPIHNIGTFQDTTLALSFIELLVEYGANLNARNAYNYNVITYMAPEGNYKVAEYLIEQGVNISDTAVMRAAAYQNTKLLSVLLQNGGNPNAQAYGHTALSDAISCCGDGFNDNILAGRLETIGVLLDNGAKPSQALMQMLNSDRYKALKDTFTQYGYN